VFGSKLDLVVGLVDTTTGAAVDEKNVLFMRDGQAVQPETRGTGVFVFINTGREDFLMRIEVSGYEDIEIPVKYDALDERMPRVDALLIPSENVTKGGPVLSFSGNLPLLEEIEAVNLNRPVCQAGEFRPKDCTLTVFGRTGGRIQLEDVWYGLLTNDKKEYEKLGVNGNVSAQAVKLKEPPREGYFPNRQMMRIIFGKVSGNGDYLLRVRDDGKDQMHLIRYVVKGREKFMTADLRTVKGGLI